ASSSAAAWRCSPASSWRGCSSERTVSTPAQSIVSRPVYKALHRPLTVCGVDRRLFFMALLMGTAMFNLFYSFLGGALTSAALYAFGFWATKRDQQMLRILLSSSRFRARYD